MANDFDPDAFLADRRPIPGPEPGGFDPDAFLAKTTPAPAGAGFDPDAFLKANPPPQAAKPEAPSQTPEPHAAVPADEMPGSFESFTEQYKRSVAQRAQAIGQTAQIAAGQKTPEQIYQEHLAHPETKDIIDKVAEMPIDQGWAHLPWWAAKAGQGFGAITPGLGAALGATAVGGPFGGIGAFMGEAGMGNFVPAYEAARRDGLPEDQAITRALTDTGIAVSFAAAMGLIGKVPLTGTMMQEVEGKAVQVLKRPAAEFLAQFGLAQPGLMVGQDVATTVSQGKGLPSLGDVATDVLMGTIVGLGIHTTFMGADKIAAARRGTPPAEPPAGAGTIAAATESQRFKGAEAPRPSAEPAAPGAPLQQEPPGDEGPPPAFRPMPSYDRDPVTREPAPIWYSQVGDIIAKKMPASASAEQVMGILRNSQIPQEMLDRSYVPSYLEDQRGAKIDKDALLAHIEANAIQIEEIHTSDTAMAAKEAIDQFLDARHSEGRYHPDQWTRAENEEYRQLVDTRAALRGNVRPIEHDAPYNWLPGPFPQTGRREMVLYVDDPVLVRARQLAKQHAGIVTKDWNEFVALLTPQARDDYIAEARKQLGNRLITTSYDEAHWPSIPNPIVHTRGEERRGPLGQRTFITVEVQSTLHQEGAKLGYAEGERAPPGWDVAGGADRPSAELPFKTDWQELALKRLMRWAVDNGYDELGLVSGDMVGLRLNSAKELAGARQNYDRDLPKIIKKWAKRFGTTTEYRTLDEVTPEAGSRLFGAGGMSGIRERMERFREMGLIGDKPFNNRILVMKLTPEASEQIRRGMPYDKDLEPKAPRVAKGHSLSDIIYSNNMAAKLARPARRVDKILNRIGTELGLTRAIEFWARPMDAEPWRGRMLPDYNPATGNYIVEVNTRRIATETDLYASMSHEFGHVVWVDYEKRASPAEHAALQKWHNDFLQKIPNDEMTVGAVRRLRDNAISLASGARAQHDGLRLSDLVPRSKAYLLSFDEHFAEEVSKWMTTDAKPLGIVQKFFKRLANALRKIMTAFSQEHPGLGTPDQVVADFLNKRWSDRPSMTEPIFEQFDQDTTKANKAAMDREGGNDSTAVPQQASTAGGRGIVASLPPSQRAAGEAMAAHADRMNWFFKLFLGLPQIQELNKGNRELALYTDMHRMVNEIQNQMMGRAWARIEQWGGIRDPRQQLGLSKFMDEYANGLFKLPHTEDGIFRRPNPEEFAALVRKHGLSDQSVRLFQGVQQDFDGFLERYRDLLVGEARKIKDPVRQKTSIENINNRIDKLLQQPFLPLTRFGKYLVTVYSHDGKIKHSEQTNSLRRQRQIKEALEKSPDRLPGDQVLPGMVPRDATPFLGMPPGLIDLLAEKLQLSDSQRAVVDQMRFDYAPGQSFKHQFRTMDLVPGYSTDFARNYADFFLHGAKHYTRVKYADQMRDQINAMVDKKYRLERIGNRDGANKLDQIVKYLWDHYEAWVNPKNDWAGVRGIAFHWYLGFNPVSALVNLTQTPLMTYPYLASVFGDVKATAALLRASSNFNNFYKKGTLQAKGLGAAGGPGFQAFFARSMGEMAGRGTLTEGQAHLLAALAEDRNLFRHFGKGGERLWLKFQEASGWMFDLTEQTNRRIAAAAALDLAYHNPGHKSIKEAIRAEPLLFQELTDPRGKGWNEHEAGAFIAAKRAVQKTQFEYQSFARPKIARGPIGGSLMVFKMFTQNTLFNLISQPAMLARWMVVMGALGGLQGLPGFETANSLIKTLAYRLLGKDFDLEDEVRRFTHDVTHDVISPNLVMHGLSSQGFGIPALMHSMGVQWFPTFDVSKNIGMGDVLGFDPAKPLGPVREPQKEMLRQIERGAGAVFGLPLSLYDFSANSDNFTSLKKYTAILPRWLGNLTTAFRWAYQGKETNTAGNAILRFNPGDTQQMMEILGRAAGFQPRRLTQEWQIITANQEAATFWDLRRMGLLREFGEAVKANSEEDKQRVVEAIRNYNEKLPEEMRTKAITGKEIRASVSQRLRVQQLQEQGLPAKKSDIPIAKSLEPYYPRDVPRDLVGAKPVN